MMMDTKLYTLLSLTVHDCPIPKKWSRLDSMPNRNQSGKCRERHKRYVEERTVAHAVVLCFQYKDPLNGEIVWAPGEFEKIVRAILKLELGYEPSYATNHEYGDVLNRFPLRAFPSVTYFEKAELQK